MFPEADVNDLQTINVVSNAGVLGIMVFMTVLFFRYVFPKITDAIEAVSQDMKGALKTVTDNSVRAAEHSARAVEIVTEHCREESERAQKERALLLKMVSEFSTSCQSSRHQQNNQFQEMIADLYSLGKVQPPPGAPTNNPQGGNPGGK